MANTKQEKPQPKLPKMIVFQTIQKNLAMAGISSKLVTQPYPFNWKIFMGFLILGSALVCMSVFISNDAKTFSEYTQSIYLSSLALLIIFALLILILKVEKLYEYINGSDQILNKPLKYSETKPISHETNEFVEKLCEIVLFVMIKLTPAFGILPWAIYIYFIYFTSDLGADAFELPQPMWFPFDWKNPIGFMIAIAIQYVMLSYMTTIGGCVIALALGAFVYGIALTKCIKGMLFAITRNAQAKTNRSHLLEQITGFLEFHSNAKQLSKTRSWPGNLALHTVLFIFFLTIYVFSSAIDDFSDIFQHFVTILFIWSLVTICGALLMIQIQLTHHSDNLAVLLITMIEAFYAFGVLFVSCEIGQRINLAFDDCSEMVDQFEWYLFPTNIQQMLPLILHFTQQSIYIKCFGSSAADRETFKYVVNTAFSYFTVLRQLYN